VVQFTRSEKRERFLAKVDRTEPDRCWEWPGFHDRHGYAKSGLGNGWPQLAHRAMYEILVGPIPDGLQIDHICHNRGCLNPAHMQAVTAKQNLENTIARPLSKSGVRGVYHDTRNPNNPWVVSVTHNGKSVYGGGFPTRDDAEHAAIALRNSLFTNNLSDRAQ
jgi:hypothetical protein